MKTFLGWLGKVPRFVWYIGVPILLFVLYRAFFSSPDIPTYLTTKAEYRDLERTIEVTGSLRPVQRVNLTAPQSERVTQILVAEGEHVVAGTALLKQDATAAQLQVLDAEAAVRQAEANIAQLRAGSTNEDVLIAQKAVESAKITLASVKADQDALQAVLEAEVNQAQTSAEQAATNLSLASEQSRTQNDSTTTTASSAVQRLDAAKEDARIAFDDAFRTAEQVKITINTYLREDRFEPEAEIYKGLEFGRGNARLRSSVRSLYAEYALAVDAFWQLALQKRVNWADKDQETTLEEALKMLEQARTTLTAATQMVEQSSTFGELTQSVLNTAITDLQTTETALNQTYRVTDDALQALTAARIAVDSTSNQNTSTELAAEAQRTTAEQALTTARQAAERTRASAEQRAQLSAAEVERAEASLAQAEAQLQKVQSGPRSVDLAGPEAALASARANLARAQKTLADTTITAPFDGVVTEINAEIGERLALGQSVITLQTPELELFASIAETDISEVRAGLPARLEFDAFDGEQDFTATVERISTTETPLQGVIYYETTFSLPEEQDLSSLLSGMTADIDIIVDTRENVLSVEEQAITRAEEPYVRTYTEQGEKELPIITEVTVTPGLEGDRYTEITTEELDEETELVLFEEPA